MKYIKKIFGLLSTLSYIIIIIYVMVNVPKLFGLKMMNIEKDNNVYFKDSIAYYYVVDAKNIRAGDSVIFKSKNNIMVGNVFGISNNEFRIKTNSSEENVLYSDIVGKNVNIFIKYLAPFIIFINNNLILSLVVLLSFILIDIILNVVDKKIKKEDAQLNENVNTNEISIASNSINDINQNIKHKKILEIDE